MSVDEQFTQLLRKCKDYDKSVIDGIPIGKIYHATSDKYAVCQEGLKPRCELSGRCGLGGGVDNLVSFTANKKIAQEIAADLKMVVAIANGEITSANYLDYLDDYERTATQTTLPSIAFTKIATNEGEGRVVLDKTISFYSGSIKKEGNSYVAGKPLSNAEIRRRGSEFLFEGKPIGIWQLPLTEEEWRFYFWDFYHNPYMWARRDYGLRPNSVIMMGFDQLTNLSHLTPYDVGVFEAEGVIPKEMTKPERADVTLRFHSVKEWFAWARSHYGDYLVPDRDVRIFLEEELGFAKLPGLDEWRLSPNMFHKLRYLPNLSPITNK